MGKVAGEEVVIEASKSAIRGRFVIKPYYQAVGPDGKRFDNTSKAELLRVLKRSYGPRVSLEIIEPEPGI